MEKKRGMGVVLDGGSFLPYPPLILSRQLPLVFGT